MRFTPLYYDPTMLLLIPALLLSLYAQFAVKNTFAKFSRESTRRGITGAQVASNILQQNGVTGTGIEFVQGTLSDHFDPRAHVLRLSHGVYDSSSIAAIGVAAHEAGHVLQHEEGYFPIAFRNSILPVARIGSTLSMPLLFIGMILNAVNLIYVGIALFSFAVLFQLVTLPVEFNASKRALIALEDGGYLTQDELPGAKKVLRAAALTYVAAAIASALQLLRFVLIAGRRR